MCFERSFNNRSRDVAVVSADDEPGTRLSSVSSFIG